MPSDLKLKDEYHLWKIFYALVSAGDITIVRGHTSGMVYQTTDFGKMKLGEPVA